MFRGDNDEKLYVLEPVVVLERNKALDRISEINAERQPDLCYDKPKQERKRHNSRNFKNFVPSSVRSSTANVKSGKNQNKRRKICKDDTNVLKTTYNKKKSARGTDRCRIDSHVTPRSKQGPEKRGIEEERPHRCSLCGDRFHTIILLAVHKRIHNSSQEGVEDFDESADIIQDVLLDNRSKDTSLAASPVLEERSSDKSQNNEVYPERPYNEPSFTAPSVPEENSLSQNMKIHYIDVDKDPLFTESSAPWKEFKMCHRDHDYALAADKNPGLKREPPGRKEKEKKKLKKKGSRKAEVLFTCNQCPASFSRSWYLQLHMILLHYIHEKNVLIECPGCYSLWEKENRLRAHIENHHNSDLAIMNAEISLSLRVPTDALTGENKKYMKKRLASEGCPVKPVSIGSERIACDWKEATLVEQNEIMDLVETELRHVVMERNKLGDHFTHSDIQRLGLEIAECLRVSHFLNDNPSKRWAQKILGSVGQIPRPGNLRFVHNVNSSYLNAVTNLSARGLTESSVFYAFELNVCGVEQNQIVQRPELPANYQVKDDPVCAILSTNANGTVLLHPTFTYRGQIIDYRNIHKTNLPPLKTSPKDFFETDYFRQWFAQFLISIPKARPILLLVEGDVSQLSYSIILMARENDIHLVFLPNRKRFVHAHQLIRKSLVSPLIQSFQNEIAEFMRSHNSQSVHLEYFGSIFDSAWDVALKNAEISKSFLQSGFLPLPQTTRPLEEAAREYLDVVLCSQDKVPVTNVPQTETQSIDSTSVLLAEPETCTVSEAPSLALQERIVKLETVEENPTCFDINNSFLPINVKEEPQEDLILPESDTPTDSLLEVKQEPIEYISTDKPVPDELGELKLEYNCASCNQSFHSNCSLKKHICVEDNDYSCSTCDAELGDEDQLLKHNCNLNLTNSVECNLHTCHICDMSFALKDTLDFHLTTHGNINVAARGQLLKESSGQQSSNTCRNQLKLAPSKSSSTVSVTHLAKTSSIHKRVAKNRNILTAHEVSSKVSSTQVSSELTGIDSLGMPISPTLSSSSRTISPSSSVSSRTLTASPCDVWGAEDDALGKKDSDKRNTNLARMQFTHEEIQKSIPKGQLIPPPLPEHDYLGQVYLCMPGKPTASTSSPKKPSEPVFGEESSRITISSLISSSHTQSGVLSRKQTKKVMRRIQLVCAESRLVKRLKK